MLGLSQHLDSEGLKCRNAGSFHPGEKLPRVWESRRPGNEPARTCPCVQFQAPKLKNLKHCVPTTARLTRPRKILAASTGLTEVILFKLSQHYEGSR